MLLVVITSVGLTRWIWHDSAHNHYQLATDKRFLDALFDVQFAISDENFNITSINHVGDVIAERHNIDFPNYAVISSCNLEVAKVFLERRPEYIMFMPCRIAVWEQAGQTQISAHLLPADDPVCGVLCDDINAMLKRIVEYGAYQ